MPYGRENCLLLALLWAHVVPHPLLIPTHGSHYWSSSLLPPLDVPGWSMLASDGLPLPNFWSLCYSPMPTCQLLIQSHSSSLLGMLKAGPVPALFLTSPKPHSSTCSISHPTCQFKCVFCSCQAELSHR